MIDVLRILRAEQAAGPGTHVGRVMGDAADEIERLRAALQPFAQVAQWAAENGHDLTADFDMLLRGPGHEIAGHLHAQSDDFVRADKVLRAAK